MIAITQARDKAKAQAGMQPADAPCDIAEENADFPADEHSEDEVVPHSSQSRDLQSLYPSYPWNHDTDFIGHTFFQGTIPPNWRRYSKGSEWLFGLNVFHPLHWFWSSLQWQQDSQSHETMSWFELALDYHACTHCPLHMPDQNTSKLTVSSIASYFMRASKRMAVICKSKLCPAEFLQHCDSLTTLGFQRMTGFSQRPKLRHPQFVHQHLLDIVQSSGNCSTIKCRSTFVKLHHAPPKLFNPVARRRLTGKQPAPVSYQTQSTRRIVKSHKATIINVEWDEQEKITLDATANWRDRQRPEKILFHNRDAESLSKHVLDLNRRDAKFVCKNCPKTSVNLSRMLNDSCGGMVDQGACLPGRQRTSVVLNQRIKIANEHNSQRTFQHQLSIPTDVDQIPSCSLCERQQHWQGWKRIRKF